MRRLIGVVAVMVGLVLVWWGLTSRTPDGLIRDGEGVLMMPAPVRGHDEHPRPVGPSAAAASSRAARVVVAGVGIDAPVEGVLERRGDGEWYPPAHGVARADGSASLTAGGGTTMLAGHVWSVGDPGVFFRLHEVRVGFEVALVAAGGVDRFRVTDVRSVARDRLPGWVWGSTSGPRRIVLVTCGGRVTDQGSWQRWDSNVIVTATHV